MGIFKRKLIHLIKNEKRALKRIEKEPNQHILKDIAITTMRETYFEAAVKRITDVEDLLEIKDGLKKKYTGIYSKRRDTAINLPAESRTPLFFMRL